MDPLTYLANSLRYCKARLIAKENLLYTDVSTEWQFRTIKGVPHSL